MSESNPHDIFVGVDTHKHTHAAVAVTGLGARVGDLTIRVGLGGHRELEAWARSLGAVRAFGVEGTGSHGAGLARFLREAGHVVHEAGRPDRKRGDETRLPARLLNVLCRFGAGSFELTLWPTLVTTRRVAGIAG